MRQLRLRFLEISGRPTALRPIAASKETSIEPLMAKAVLAFAMCFSLRAIDAEIDGTRLTARDAPKTKGTFFKRLSFAKLNKQHFGSFFIKPAVTSPEGIVAVLINGITVVTKPPAAIGRAIANNLLQITITF
ncbi:MAG: hypothetical protein FWG10_09615 [Eubacteriaceae bacterium]|nr:hypothetical protein [Eubacteriaceae bacterium]